MPAVPDADPFVHEMSDTRASIRSPRKSGHQRWIIPIAALCGSLSLTLPHEAAAQGVSTAVILGTVRTEDGASAEGARVRVLNSATGFALNTQVTSGRFAVHGLEVGGPYLVEVRHLGFLPQRSAQLFATLGEPLGLRFVLQRVTARLDTVLVSAPESGASVSGGGGTVTIIADSLVHRLPTLNRDFYDFVPLAPHVSTKVGFQRKGISAAGANLRFNSFLINGADERNVNGSISAAANIGRSISLDAVKEYQVLVAPYDVRYGDFAGAMVNTVTQSGTNDLRGSVFAYWRNNQLARDAEPYERLQYGFSLGGPIIRNRLHFFIAPELQRLTSPAPGPYVGQDSTAEPRVPVSEADVARFEAIMRGHGLTPGTGSFVELGNPIRNLFARFDAAIPEWRTRVIGSVAFGRAEEDGFSRDTLHRFYLSSALLTAAAETRRISLHLHTDLARRGGGHNELIVSEVRDRIHPFPAVRQPLVQVGVTGAGGAVTLIAGTPDQAHGTFRRGRSIKIKDELLLPLGARHLLVLGFQGERFSVQPGGVRNGYGTWTFSSLDRFAEGVAQQFALNKDLGSAGAELRGGQYAAYVGDEWRAGDQVSITLGVRADLLDVSGRAPYHAAVDSIFGRRTDEMPHARVHVSPRLGFTWDLPGTADHQLRGGVGVFVGRPPLAWLQPALSNYGVGIATLTCSAEAGGDPPPHFVPDYRNPPTACLGGTGLTTSPGDVNLLSPTLRMAEALRTSLAYDRRLPWGLFASGELLVSRYLSDFIWVNLNLEGPQTVDRFGRVMYGTIGANGIPNLTGSQRSTFPEVIDLRNTSKNYTYQLSARLERRIEQGFGATASYTFSRARDVQSPSRVNMRGTAMWADARALSGRHEDQTIGISLNDLPHRAVAAVTYTPPWRRWSTGLSFYYVGESGSPFTYVSFGLNRRGDLNADGSNANDPIYVPRSAFDTSEVRFEPFGTVTAAQQAEAFARFIEGAPCLRRQRGRIMERNSCREPWSHTTIASVRQAIPIGPRALEVELDVFNVLNLLNAGWGRYRVAAPRVLQHVGQTASAQPVFRFDVTRAEWTPLETESAFQLQLAVRLRF